MSYNPQEVRDERGRWASSADHQRAYIDLARPIAQLEKDGFRPSQRRALIALKLLQHVHAQLHELAQPNTPNSPAKILAVSRDANSVFAEHTGEEYADSIRLAQQSAERLRVAAGRLIPTPKLQQAWASPYEFQGGHSGDFARALHHEVASARAAGGDESSPAFERLKNAVQREMRKRVEVGAGEPLIETGRVEGTHALTFQGKQIRYNSDNAPNVAHTLSRLLVSPPPPALWNAHTHLTFAAGGAKSQTFWGAAWGRAGHRAVATARLHGGVVIYHNAAVPVSIINHEAGHMLAEQLWGSHTPPAHTPFGTAGPEAPVSEYGKTNGAEDFAEAVELYARHPAHLKEIAPQRFAALQATLGEPTLKRLSLARDVIRTYTHDVSQEARDAHGRWTAAGHSQQASHAAGLRQAALTGGKRGEAGRHHALQLAHEAAAAIKSGQGSSEHIGKLEAAVTALRIQHYQAGKRGESDDSVAEKKAVYTHFNGLLKGLKNAAAGKGEVPDVGPLGDAQPPTKAPPSKPELPAKPKPPARQRHTEPQLASPKELQEAKWLCGEAEGKFRGKTGIDNQQAHYTAYNLEKAFSTLERFTRMHEAGETLKLYEKGELRRAAELAHSMYSEQFLKGKYKDLSALARDTADTLKRAYGIEAAKPEPLGAVEGHEDRAGTTYKAAYKLPEASRGADFARALEKQVKAARAVGGDESSPAFKRLRQAVLERMEQYAYNHENMGFLSETQRKEGEKSLIFHGLTVYYNRANAENAAHTLARILIAPPPSAMWRSHTTLHFATGGAMSNAYWAAAFNNPHHFAVASARRDGGITVYLDKAATLRTMNHEAGHMLANRIWGTSTPPDYTPYTQAMRTGEKPVSAYAANNGAEDFAEAAALYATNPQKLKLIAPYRYDAIHKLMEAHA